MRPGTMASRGSSRSCIAYALLFSSFGLSSFIRGQDVPLKRLDFSGPAMATTFRIHLYAADEEKAKTAVDAAFDRVAKLNGIFSDYEPESELMQLCTSGRSPFPASKELFSTIQRACELSAMTDGAFDITCGHLTRLWRRTRNLKKLPPMGRLKEAIALTDWRQIQLDAEHRQITLMRPKMLLDLGGIAKGRAADEMLEVLRAHGLTIASVQAGGDTVCGDPPPGEEGWKVALRTFSKADETEPPEITLAHAAVSTSGDLYQSVQVDGVHYSHIVSPKTGLGLTRLIACAVVAPNATTSDALATAGCILGPQEGAEVLTEVDGVFARWFWKESATETALKTQQTPGFPTTDK